MTAQPQGIPSMRSAHLFRSKFVDSFSRVESWTIAAWRKLAECPDNKCKIPPHFGNRVKRIRDLAKSDPDIFSTPHETASLLDQLEPYYRLRATLMHGRFEIATAADGTAMFLVDNPLDEGKEGFANRIALRSGELNWIIQRLDNLGEALANQTLIDRP